MDLGEDGACACQLPVTAKAVIWASSTPRANDAAL